MLKKELRLYWTKKSLGWVKKIIVVKLEKSGMGRG